MKNLYEINLALEISGEKICWFKKTKNIKEHIVITRKIFCDYDNKTELNDILNKKIDNWKLRNWVNVGYHFYNDNYDSVYLKEINNITFKILNKRECTIEECFETLTPIEFIESYGFIIKGK